MRRMTDEDMESTIKTTVTPGKLSNAKNEIKDSVGKSLTKVIIIALVLVLIAVSVFAYIVYSQIPPLICENNIYLKIDGVITYVNNICYAPVP